MVLPGSSRTRVQPTMSSARQQGMTSRPTRLFMNEGYTGSPENEPPESGIKVVSSFAAIIGSR